MNEQLLLNSIADLRAALVAASGILSRQPGQAELASLLFRAANEDGEARKAAVRALEEDAGYIPGTGRGEAYP